jgi:hypothetical protein
VVLEQRLNEAERERARLAQPGTPLASIEDVREIAAEEAARVAAASETERAPGPPPAVNEEEIIEALEQRQRRSAALSTVGRRIAAAGPLLRESGEETEPLTEELLFVANQLQLTEAERASLARNQEARTCISTRLAERGFFAAFNQRLSSERLASYLSVCFDG